MPLSLEEIAEIIKLIDESSCDEFVIEVGDLKVAVRRKSAGTTQSDMDITPQPGAAPPPPPPNTMPDSAGAGANVTGSGSKTAATTERTDGLTEIRCPMSGIFYRRPTPDADPFVSVGSQVNKGDPLCMVEVMKLFTTVNAEQPGRVVEITAEDGQQVEHDQILFLIEPS